MTKHLLKPIHIKVELSADIDTVWYAWTTEKGVQSFFAPDSKIDLQVGGEYEIFFNPEKTTGIRGAEGTRILAIEPKKFLSFSWNNPPALPEIRWQYSNVCLYFKALDSKKTQLELVHAGWGTGEIWEKARVYFERAWKDVVIPRLISMLTSGPINWPQV